MKPRGPNENTKAIEVVKGGEISGSRVAISSSFAERRRAAVRSTVKANRKPSTVPQNADQRCQQEAVAERPQIALAGDGGNERGEGESVVV